MAIKKCAIDFLERNKDILKGDKPYPLVMNLNGWYKACPACLMVYNNNGVCSYCGLEITIEGKEKKRYNGKQ